MRLLILIVALPLAALATWWSLSSSGVGDGPTTTNFEVRRRTFQVTLQEKGELEAAKSITINSEVEGRSTIISLVPEGSSVKQGDLLVELASEEIDERLQSHKIEVASAQSALESAERQLEILKAQNASDVRKASLNLELKKLELERYEKGEWKQQQEDAKLRLDEAVMVYEREKTNFENAKVLLEKKFITRTEYDENEFNLYKADVNVAKARRDQESLETYTRVIDKQQKESDVDEAEKELQRVEQEADNKQREKEAAVQARRSELDLKQQRLTKLEEQMAKTKIRAPADGLVVYGGDSNRRWGNDEPIKEGVEVFERQTIMRLPDTTKMKVVLRIHEAQTDKIKIGQPATIEVEGIKHRTYTGKISKIAVLADSQNRWLNPELKEYETEITLNEEDELLKPGVTARVEILVDELADVLAVPVQSVFSKGAQSYVFVDGGEPEPVTVELGLASTEFVEIKSGLSAGQTVMLAVPDALKHKLPAAQQPASLAESEGAPRPSARPEGSRGQRRGGQRPRANRG